MTLYCTVYMYIHVIMVREQDREFMGDKATGEKERKKTNDNHKQSK